MASRAILRRNKGIFDHFSSSARSSYNLHRLQQGAPRLDSCGNGSYGSCQSSGLVNVKEPNDAAARKLDAFGVWGDGHFRSSFYSRAILGSRNVRAEFFCPLRLMSTSPGNVSTATAKQPESGVDDEGNEESMAKKRKEVSPEDCDEAVEGLSTAKAKAKAKKLQESQTIVKSVLEKTWAVLLGIGPALRAVAAMSREDWANKLVHWKKEIISTLKHYWLGFKLLGADVRISIRLLLKLAEGKSLSRRERQQLTRTTADIFRLVPFAVFIIVPFMEFLLPVFLKLFPNMLPSTFQDKMKEQEALKRRLNARIEYAKFLQETVKEMAKEVQNSRSGETKRTAEDLDEFLNKVRKGSSVSNDEILSFAKLFNDELTLDNISRPRLVSMCKYMGISPFGTDSYLRFMLRKRLQSIKADDKMIQEEGIETLTEDELRAECRERGMLGLLSVEEMREQEEEEKEEEELARIKEHKVREEEDVALKEMTTPTANEAQQQARERTLEKQEELCELSRALAVLASASSVSREREQFLRLVNKEIKLYNSMIDSEGIEDEKAAMKAYRAAKVEKEKEEEEEEADEVSSALIDRVDAMLQKLEKEIDDVDAEIGDRFRLLDRDYDGKVTPDEVAAAANYLKNTLGKEGIQELISNLAKDSDGKIRVEDIVKLGSRSEEESGDGEEEEEENERSK
ncbi:Mitochondrial proton/calcium exchanger protein [Linum perenne]